MSKHDSPSIRRFVRNAWILLGFQLVASAAAAGLAIWAVSSVRNLIEQRDMLRARVGQLEARPGPAAAPAETPPESQSVPPDPEPAPAPRVDPVPTPAPGPPPPPDRRGSNRPPDRVPEAVPPPVPPPYQQPYRPPYQPPAADRTSPKPEANDEPPPPPRRRRGPSLNIDVPGLIGTIGNRPRRDPPVRTPPNRNPAVPPRGSPTRPPSNVPGVRQPAAPPRTTRPSTNVPGQTATVPRTRRRVPPATTQPPIR